MNVENIAKLIASNIRTMDLKRVNKEVDGFNVLHLISNIVDVSPESFMLNFEDMKYDEIFHSNKKFMLMEIPNPDKTSPFKTIDFRCVVENVIHENSLTAKFIEEQKDIIDVVKEFQSKLGMTETSAKSMSTKGLKAIGEDEKVKKISPAIYKKVLETIINTKTSKYKKLAETEFARIS